MSDEFDAHAHRREAAIEKFMSMGPRSGRNFLLNRAMLAFYAPLGIEANYVFYDALSVAEGAPSWPQLVLPTFNPSLAADAKVAMDLIAGLAAAVSIKHASVAVSGDGMISIDLPDPTRSKQAAELSRLMEEDDLERKLRDAARLSGTCFCRYLATAVALLAAQEAPLEATEEFIFSEADFITRLDTLFFDPTVSPGGAVAVV